MFGSAGRGDKGRKAVLKGAVPFLPLIKLLSIISIDCFIKLIRKEGGLIVFRRPKRRRKDANKRKIRVVCFTKPLILSKIID